MPTFLSATTKDRASLEGIMLSFLTQTKKGGGEAIKSFYSTRSELVHVSRRGEEQGMASASQDIRTRHAYAALLILLSSACVLEQQDMQGRIPQLYRKSR
jgi:hypothetical protein